MKILVNKESVERTAFGSTFFCFCLLLYAIYRITNTIIKRIATITVSTNIVINRLVSAVSVGSPECNSVHNSVGVSIVCVSPFVQLMRSLYSFFKH